jgi:hypothetical protein
MTLPTPTELTALAISLAVLAGLSAYFLPGTGVRLAMYLGAAAAACFLAAGVAHTYKQQGVDAQAAKDGPVMQAAADQLKADVVALNEIARIERERKADNERDAAILRSSIAAASVRERANAVERDNAAAEAARLLAENRDLLRRISLPGGVRVAFDTAAAGRGDGKPADVRPDTGRPASEGAAPVDAATFTETCVADVEAHRLLADQYDRLYDYASKLYSAASAHSQ